MAPQYRTRLLIRILITVLLIPTNVLLKNQKLMIIQHEIRNAREKKASRRHCSLRQYLLKTGEELDKPAIAHISANDPPLGVHVCRRLREKVEEVGDGGVKVSVRMGWGLGRWRGLREEG